mmetsp:Transcript_22516/g.69774  ORF Transcript_22516/g.69774 Transcript_22516/m.69774 type:complete len:628 (-) Transcript_22516:73-1956(-)|eukprot:CAMPEP_0118852880 /NCGR_PEP_ID=MMETSP1163-20130328/1686_1 /TAXON_ID=124430 /ORGANISM="Phaeomonas parva, Strain CCMP2877" /LENGTH=627 /DNA_ID=CAMNT_0006785349 /DNA_START=262 /DNA_END=2145 /DNA_ORIENTATION=+
MGASCCRCVPCRRGGARDDSDVMRSASGLQDGYQPPPLSLGVLRGGDEDMNDSHSIVLAATYCRNSSGYEWLETPLLSIGSRPEKRSFLVHALPGRAPLDDDDGVGSVLGGTELWQRPVEVLMTFIDKKSRCPLSLKNGQTFEAFAALLGRKLRHPLLYPALDVDYIRGRDRLVIFRRFEKRGSLRDLLWAASPREAFARKYRRGGKQPKSGFFRHAGHALGDASLRRYGRHILLALAALRSKGIVFDHLHCGNVIVDKEGDRARLTDVENSLLSLKPTLSMEKREIPNPSLDPDAPPTIMRGTTALDIHADFHGRVEVDALLFAHVLWEMATGYQLEYPRPSEEQAAAGYAKMPHAVQELLRGVFEFRTSARGGEGVDPGAPTVESMLENPYFNQGEEAADILEAKLYLDSASKKIVKRSREARLEMYANHLSSIEERLLAEAEEERRIQLEAAERERERASSLASPVLSMKSSRRSLKRRRSRETPGARSDRGGRSTASGSLGSGGSGASDRYNVALSDDTLSRYDSMGMGEEGDGVAPAAATTTTDANDAPKVHMPEHLVKYVTMQKMGLPPGAVHQKMRMEGCSDEDVNLIAGAAGGAGALPAAPEGAGAVGNPILQQAEAVV